MLLSLCTSLQSGLLSCVHQFKAKLHDLGDRVDRVEISLGEYTSSFNTMVNAHAAHSDDIAWLKDKVVDLEDRSRGNNIKIRGVPESVFSNQLQQYTQDLFSTLVPFLSGPDLAIDRIHRLPKPSFLPAEVPRDVLLRVHFYQAK